MRRGGYGLPYLHSYTFFLASWSALVLFSIFQYILAISFLPGGTWFPLTQATSPLFVIVMAGSLYFISAFLAQLSGSPLTKPYKIVFVAIWVGLASVTALVNERLFDSTAAVDLGISARETEIVELIVKGLSNKEIADKLCISVDTVKNHSYNSHKKLSVQNRVQLSYLIQNLPAKNRG